MLCRLHYNGTSQLIRKYRVQWGVDTVRRWQECWWGSNCWRQWRQNSPTAGGLLSPPSPFEKLAGRFAPLWADDVLLDATCADSWLQADLRRFLSALLWRDLLARSTKREKEQHRYCLTPLTSFLYHPSLHDPLPSSFRSCLSAYYHPPTQRCFKWYTLLTWLTIRFLTDLHSPTSPHVRQNRQIGACPLFLEQNVPAFFLLQGI